MKSLIINEVFVVVMKIILKIWIFNVMNCNGMGKFKQDKPHQDNLVFMIIHVVYYHMNNMQQMMMVNILQQQQQQQQHLMKDVVNHHLLFIVIINNIYNQQQQININFSNFPSQQHQGGGIELVSLMQNTTDHPGMGSSNMNDTRLVRETSFAKHASNHYVNDTSNTKPTTNSNTNNNNNNFHTDFAVSDR
eukprot:UN09179